MNDTDFIKAMSQGLPPIAPPVRTQIRSDGLLLGNGDIEVNDHEAIHGICAEDDTHA